MVGSGASGVTCLSLLERLAREVGGVEVSWVTRRPLDVPPYSVLEGDPLPEREALYRLGNRLAAVLQYNKYLQKSPRSQFQIRKALDILQQHIK